MADVLDIGEDGTFTGALLERNVEAIERQNGHLKQKTPDPCRRATKSVLKSKTEKTAQPADGRQESGRTTNSELFNGEWNSEGSVSDRPALTPYPSPCVSRENDQIQPEKATKNIPCWRDLVNCGACLRGENIGMLILLPIRYGLELRSSRH